MDAFANRKRQVLAGLVEDLSPSTYPEIFGQKYSSREERKNAATHPLLLSSPSLRRSSPSSLWNSSSLTSGSSSLRSSGPLARFASETAVKPDKSLKHSVDGPFVPACAVLNDHPNYYTTSCCSGRVCVFVEPADAKAAGKYAGRLMFVAHEEAGIVSARELHAQITRMCRPVQTGVDNNTAAKTTTMSDSYRNRARGFDSVGIEPPTGIEPVRSNFDGCTIWLKHEPLLLHVRCRRLEDADRLLRLARAAGLKEIGIATHSDAKGWLVSISGSSRVCVPVKSHRHDLFDVGLLEQMLAHATLKFFSNQATLRKFTTLVSADLGNFRNLDAMLPYQMPSDLMIPPESMAPTRSTTASYVA